MSAAFQRKNIRLNAENYRGDRSYFLTLCFEGRRTYGTNPQTALWLTEQLREAAARKGFLIHAYCLMPDHLHLLAVGMSAQSDLLAFVKLYKQETAYVFRRETGKALWQFKFYDHILRKRDAAECVAWYIWMNPVRKGLCKRALDYLHSGAFTEEGARLLRSFPREDWLPPWKPGGANAKSPKMPP